MATRCIDPRYLANIIYQVAVHRRCDHHDTYCRDRVLRFPDVPSRKRPRCLSEAEHDYANKRLAGLTAPPQLKISKSIFERVLSNWHFYAFVIQWTLMDQNFAPYSQPFSLYLKAKSDLYSVVRINTLPTVATAISIASALLSGIIADKTGRF